MTYPLSITRAATSSARQGEHELVDCSAWRLHDAVLISFSGREGAMQEVKLTLHYVWGCLGMYRR